MMQLLRNVEAKELSLKVIASSLCKLTTLRALRIIVINPSYKLLYICCIVMFTQM